MPNDPNKETQETLKREIKAIQTRCVDVYNVINNAPQDIPAANDADKKEKTLCYIEGLKTEVQNSNTLILTDENLLTSQFLNELKENTAQIEELTAFMQGTVHDLDEEINGLKAQIKITQEAKSRPRACRQEVTQEHIQKVKEKFHAMRSELHGIINSLFPDAGPMIHEFLGKLMEAKSDESSNGYVPVPSENYKIVKMLKDINLVTFNPYNKMEVKLSY